MFETIGAIIGYGIIGGVAISGLSSWIFKTFIERWLNTKFAERLESYKHEQVKELEQLRFKINGLMDRTTKLHQHEFRVLPTLWSRLIMANGYVGGVVSSIQSYPDVDSMNSAHLAEFLESSSLAQWQKNELEAASNKTDYYIKAVAFERLHKARSVYIKFNVYLHKTGIFLQPEIKAKFITYGDLLHSALVEHEMNIQHQPTPRMRESITKLNREGKTLLDERDCGIRRLSLHST